MRTANRRPPLERWACNAQRPRTSDPHACPLRHTHLSRCSDQDHPKAAEEKRSSARREERARKQGELLKCGAGTAATRSRSSHRSSACMHGERRSKASRFRSSAERVIAAALPQSAIGKKERHQARGFAPPKVASHTRSLCSSANGSSPPGSASARLFSCLSLSLSLSLSLLNTSTGSPCHPLAPILACCALLLAPHLASTR